MESKSMNRLDLNRFPLTGTSLIEASAGTGKTFTIAGLYSRLILGHQTGYERLRADQILVVTFTNAATEELRGRIRERIRSNLDDVLRMQAGMEPRDEQFSGWVQECLEYVNQQQAPESANQQQVLESVNPQYSLEDISAWLQANLALMDSATIFTIHGFAQRMLKQFAFDTGALFSAELQLDAGEQLKRASEDVWRSLIYPANAGLAASIRNRFSTPDKLLNRIQSWLSRQDLVFLPNEISALVDEQQGASAAASTKLAQLWSAIERDYSELQTLWTAIGSQGVIDLIQASGVSKKKYTKRYLPAWVAQVEAWLTGGHVESIPDNAYRLSASTLEAATEKGEAPQHAIFQKVESLLGQWQFLNLGIVRLSFEAIKERFFELMEESGLVSADDLLSLLDKALVTEKGALLARQIRQLYPIAMIDEFQDTDPIQYRIFTSIYSDPEDSTSEQEGDETQESTCGLVAIGDPKQAIYAFRGADIFTYIQARRQMPEQRIFTLDTNWRSQSNLINAVNQLFEQHPSPFVFDDDIPFYPVKASGRRDSAPLSIKKGDLDEEIAPFQIWFDEEELDLTSARERAVSQCAEQIQAVLNGAGQLGGKSVQAGDIAVLVRTRQQGIEIKRALAAAGVNAVMLSRDSVLTSEEARELLLWLMAVAEPSNERSVRSAFATRLQGLSLSQLDTLATSEDEWESAIVRVTEWHELWQRRGIMAAILSWLNEDNRAARIVTEVEGERRLTNLLHLAELLQTASQELSGHLSLVRWFKDKIQDAETSASEAAQLRLETDGNLVSIVTIHRSKGLEYPLVFLPFLWTDSSDIRGKDQALYFDEKRGQVVMNLSPDEDDLDKARRDLRAENMRLLYVALTRPRQGCFLWLMSGGKKGTQKQNGAWQAVMHKSAIGQLLHTDQLEECSAAQLNQTLTAEGLFIGAFESWQSGKGLAPVENSIEYKTSVRAREFRGLTYDDWQVSSFSRLTADAHNGHHPISNKAVSDLPDERLRLDDDLDARFNQADAELEARWPMRFRFPKGAQPGTCLHSILEHWDFQDQVQLAGIIDSQLHAYGLHEEVAQSGEGSVEDISDWLTQVVQTSLADDFGRRFRLADLQPDYRLDEMEFHLPARSLAPGKLDALLQASAEENEQNRSLSFDPVRGYIKGFIDLVFEYEGRYYLLDYKSNFLGPTLIDYSPEPLREAMQSHYYDLQSWIYTLALDRFLSSRIKDYQPEQHLGGVYYLFLRGLSADDETWSQLPESVSSASSTTDVQQKEDNSPELNTGTGQLDLFATTSDGLEPLATSSMTESNLQCSGVYYHSIQADQLQQWREVFLPEVLLRSVEGDAGHD